MDDVTQAGRRALPCCLAGRHGRGRTRLVTGVKVLTAAEQLFSTRGVDAISMDDVAAVAEVGKGTLYRRFGDKSGLAAALLDARESELQAAMLGGPPPLGPGAHPADRLAAFAAAYLAYVDTHLDLVALSQTASPGARLRTGSHQLWKQHCQILLTAAGAPTRTCADTLLATLTAEQVRHWRRDENRPLPELTDAIIAISRRLATPDQG